MKRTDIRAGVVYAVKNDRGAPSPIMFLEDRAAGIYSRQRGGGIRQEQENSYTKAHRASGWSGNSIGYATVVMDWMTAGTNPAPLPWNIDPATELERFRAGEPPSVPGLRFDITTSLAKIVRWDEAEAENEARQAAEREAAAKSAEARARLDAAREGLRALGIDTGYSFASYKIELPVWEVEKLLAMLRDREA
jgi:hypothetical protein